MFSLLRNGVHHSAHETYADACKLARMQAARDKQAYFTVHCGNHRQPLYKTAAISGINTFIVQPVSPQSWGSQNTQLH